MVAPNITVTPGNVAALGEKWSLSWRAGFAHGVGGRRGHCVDPDPFCGGGVVAAGVGVDGVGGCGVHTSRQGNWHPDASFPQRQRESAQ
jgi:hypothetical protein